MSVFSKKYVALLLTVAMAVLYFTACGPNEQDVASSGVNSATAESSISNNSSVSDSSQSNENSSNTSQTTEPDTPTEPDEPVDPSLPLTPLPQGISANSVDSFFDNSVFVGYSIMMHFGRYIDGWKGTVDSSIMGDVTFCSAVGINFLNNNRQTPSTPGNSLPRYRGVAYNFEDLPAATGCSTIYFGLTPYSDMRRLGTSQSCTQLALEEVVKCLEKLKQKSPNVNIVILSGTYNTGTFKGLGINNASRLSNENIRKFNNLVLDYCNKNGIDFVDVSTPLVNGYGYMPVEYSSDSDYHIAKEAFLIWVDVLRDYARQKQNGSWKNYTVMPTLGV